MFFVRDEITELGENFNLMTERLQNFYENLIAGKRPRLAISAPPQHGKSWAATDFMSWVAGKNPDLKIIFASTVIISACTPILIYSASRLPPFTPERLGIKLIHFSELSARAATRAQRLGHALQSGADAEVQRRCPPGHRRISGISEVAPQVG